MEEPRTQRTETENHYTILTKYPLNSTANMTGSPLPLTPPEPETPTLLTTPKIPMTPHPARVLHLSTPQAFRRHSFSPITQTPDSNRTLTRNFWFRRRLRSSVIDSPSRTPTPTPGTSPGTSPSTSPSTSPTPPYRYTSSYIKAQKHITNLRYILSRVHVLNLNPRRFNPDVRKSLAGIEWGLYFLLEGGDVYQYLFPKKEGRGKGVWMDADVEGLMRRSGFWVRVWSGVRGVVRNFEEEESEGKKRKREEGGNARSESQCAKKGRD